MPLFKKKKDKKDPKKEREGSVHADDRPSGALGTADSASHDDIRLADARLRTGTEVASPRPSFLPSQNVVRSNTSVGPRPTKPTEPRLRPGFPLVSTVESNEVSDVSAGRPLSLNLSNPPKKGPIIREKQNGIENSEARFSVVEDEGQNGSEEDKLREALREVTGCEKAFRWQETSLLLPPVVPAPAAKPRTLNLQRREQGDFGFTLRQPAGDSRAAAKGHHGVHMLEPKDGAHTGVVHGDHLLAVNDYKVDGVGHNRVVELIRSSGETLKLVVASAPELAEVSKHGGLDVTSSFKQEAGKTVLEVRAGTLRRTPADRVKARNADRLPSISPQKESDRVWLVHSNGFSAATLVKDRRGIARLPSDDVTFGTEMRDERCSIKLNSTGEVREVDAGDIEKGNPSSFDRVEDLASLRYLNESSILHTLRQRLGNSLIHTYAGSHLIIMNPVRSLPIYSDKVALVFQGCRREDMPPHVFAAAQTAYSNMMKMKSDQSLITMGISGSGKTYNARHMQRYLTSVATSGNAVSLGMKLDAAQLMLEAFGHAITNLNRSATRFSRILSLRFDFSGMITGASLQVSLIEKRRSVQRGPGEYNFNIFYYLIAGSTGKIRNDLQLDAGKTQQNAFFTPPENAKEIEWAKKGWYSLSGGLEHLKISADEAKALWSLLAAVYHLGFSGAARGPGAQDRGRFIDPTAAQRAASLLGVTQDELKHAMFALPGGIRRAAFFHGTTESPSPPGTPTSTQSSQSYLLQAPSAEAALEAFAMGLYEQAFSSLVSLINRCLHSSAHHVSTINIVDMPGFQNPSLAFRNSGASFDDLLHNYAQERLQMTFYNTVFVTEQDRYAQENVAVNFTAVPQSPLSIISFIDRMGTQSSMRSSGEFRSSDSKGLLHILDEESIFPGATTSSFLERLQFHARSDDPLRGKPLVQVFPELNSFVLNHCQKTLPILYKADNWLRWAREHPATRAAITMTTESVKGPIAALTAAGRNRQGSIASRQRTLTGDSLALFKQRTLQRGVGGAGVKRHSVSLQTKLKLDVLMDILRRSQQTFVHCFLPRNITGMASRSTESSPRRVRSTDSVMDIPFVRNQMRRVELLNALRIYRQGFPEHMVFGDFVKHFDLLVAVEDRVADTAANIKESVEKLLGKVDVEKSCYRIGETRVFFRAGTVASLENRKEQSSESRLVGFQAHCRGYLARRIVKKNQGQHVAIRCVQKNVRKYLVYQKWSWWKLYTKIIPLLDVHRTEEELKDLSVEVEKLRGKVAHLEQENAVIKENESSLTEEVQRLSSELAEEHASAVNAHEVLETEQMEKLRLEQALGDLQEKHGRLQRLYDQLEMEVEDIRVLGHKQFGSDSDEDAAEASDLYYQKYQRARRELEMARKRWQMETEDEIEGLAQAKKTAERKLTEALAEVEEVNNQLATMRRKANRLDSELADVQLHLESELDRNAELEKKQKRFDHELAAALNQLERERAEGEKATRSKEKEEAEKYSLQRKLEEKEGELSIAERKLHRVQEELSEVSQQGSKEEKEVTALKQSKRDIEQKLEDQEEELDDMAARTQQLESAKLRLEIENQRLEQQLKKSVEAKEEEHDRQVNQLHKKVKSLEEQLDREYEEKSAAQRMKRDVEYQLAEAKEQAQRRDPEAERRLRKALQKTKALLHDTQEMLQLEQTKHSAGGRSSVRSLRNELDEMRDQLEQSTRAKRKFEVELEDKQQLLTEVTRDREMAEQRVSELNRQKVELESKLEDDQEDLNEIVTKHKNTLQQLTAAQTQHAEAEILNSQLSNKNLSLKNEVEELTQQLESLQRSAVSQGKASAMEFKVREVEEKLEMEQAARHRQDNYIRRLKDNLKRLGEEKEELQRGDGTVAESLRRSHRQIRELKDELMEKEKKEQEISRKNRQLESDREMMESNLSSVQKELERANKRIQDLRGALQDFSDQSDLEADPLDGLDDSASSDGEEGGHWASSHGDRTFKHRYSYKDGVGKKSTLSTRRIADVDDFENVTPNTLQKWRVERETGDDDNGDLFAGQKREDGDDLWYSSSSPSSTGAVGYRNRRYQNRVGDGLDSPLSKTGMSHRLRDGDNEREWFEDSSPPVSPKPTFL